MIHWDKKLCSVCLYTFCLHMFCLPKLDVVLASFYFIFLRFFKAFSNNLFLVVSHVSAQDVHFKVTGSSTIQNIKSVFVPYNFK